MADAIDFKDDLKCDQSPFLLFFFYDLIIDSVVFKFHADFFIISPSQNCLPKRKI